MEEYTTPLEEQLAELRGTGKVGALFTGGLDEFLSSIVANVARMGDSVNAALTASDVAGGLLIWQNPTGHTIMVDEGRLWVQTASTGACTVSIGLNAAATPLVPAVATQMYSGQSVATAGLFPATTAFIVGPGAYVVASVASGASAGLVGRLRFNYVVVAA